MYKLLLAALGGFALGAGAATFVCYTMWRKDQKALLDEIGDLYDNVDELMEENERLTNTAVFEAPIDEVPNEPSFKEPEDDGEGAKCSEDGVPEVTVNKCSNPRFIIGTDDDLVDYWKSIYTTIEVLRDPYGIMTQIDVGGYEKPFYPEQVGGTGNVILALTTDHALILDNMRGVIIHITQLSEEEMAPLVYENEVYDEDEYYY